MAVSTKQLVRSLNRLLGTHFRWVSFTVIVILVAAGYYFFLGPKLTEIRRVGVFDLERKKEQLQLKQNIYQTTRELRDRYDQLNLENVEKLAGLLPLSQQLPELFVQIEALATASGLRLENVGFAEIGTASAPTRARATTEEEDEGAAATPTSASTTVRSRQTLKKLSVTFSVSGGGGYHDLKNFLANTESSLRLLDVQSLTYTPTEEERYQINAITYYLQQ